MAPRRRALFRLGIGTGGNGGNGQEEGEEGWAFPLVTKLQLGNATAAKLCLACAQSGSAKRSFEEVRSQAGAWEREEGWASEKTEVVTLS